MIRSLALFVHIAGVLTMFAGLALEAFGNEAARKAAPRISGIAMGVTLLSGFSLGARFGVLGSVWLRATYAAIVLMAVAGALGRRSDTLLRLSWWVRTAFGLAIVFLMVAKPDAVGSLAVLSLALGVSALSVLPKGERQGIGVSRA
jgi:hypothetical protein